MKNLSLSHLFKCHLIYTAMVRVAFTDTAIVKDFRRFIMKQEYISYWQNTLHHS